ncbi:hypothetical protein [Archangium violaceum]
MRSLQMPPHMRGTTSTRNIHTNIHINIRINMHILTRFRARWT